MMDDGKEAEKWEHLEELRLWMKHVVGLMSDIINNGLGQAFFIRTSSTFIILDLYTLLVCLWLCVLLQDLKETFRLKSGFIHAKRGG